MELLEKELIESNLTSNRYSIVIFGGDGVFDQPRSLIIKNDTFSDIQQIIPYFDSIPTGE